MHPPSPPRRRPTPAPLSRPGDPSGAVHPLLPHPPRPPPPLPVALVAVCGTRAPTRCDSQGSVPGSYGLRNEVKNKSPVFRALLCGALGSFLRGCHPPGSPGKPASPSGGGSPAPRVSALSRCELPLHYGELRPAMSRFVGCVSIWRLAEGQPARGILARPRG